MKTPGTKQTVTVFAEQFKLILREEEEIINHMYNKTSKHKQRTTQQQLQHTTMMSMETSDGARIVEGMDTQKTVVGRSNVSSVSKMAAGKNKVEKAKEKAMEKAMTRAKAKAKAD